MACSSERDMLRRIRRRVPVRIAPAAEHAQLLQFYVEAAETNGAVGRFSITDEQGRSSAPRSVEGADCDEVADKLSLMAALSLREGATGDPGASPDRPRLDEDVLRALEVPAPPPAAPAHATTEWQFGAGLHTALDTYGTSRAVWGGGLHVQARSPANGWFRLGLGTSSADMHAHAASVQ